MPRLTPRTDHYEADRASVTVNGINLEAQFGLRLTGYSVGVPTPLVKLIDVPGRPGKLDATLALNGKVNYSTRPITAEFHIRNNPYPDFQTLLSQLLPLLNGTESRVEFSTDPGWYYKGRFTLGAKKGNPVSSVFTLSCADAFPYKLETVSIQKNVGTFTCTGKAWNGPMTVISTWPGMSLTFGDKTYTLKYGEDILRDLHLEEGTNTLQLTGSTSGHILISYERGIL